MSHRLPEGRTAAVETLFAQICRATPEEARSLSMLFGASERAAMALACNARTHLRDHGRAIATTCSRESLVAEGGQAGLVLFNQLGSGGDTWGAAPRAEKRRISLAG
jgi:hypothetical protein